MDAEPIPDLAVAAAPVAPAEMEVDDEAGAAAAAVYFLELWSYTMQTGDVTAWENMSGELCQFCSQARTTALSMQEAGVTFTGGVVTSTGVHMHPFDELAGAYPVDVDVMLSLSALRGATGELISYTTPSTEASRFRVDVIRSDDDWEILEVTFEPAS